MTEIRRPSAVAVTLQRPLCVAQRSTRLTTTLHTFLLSLFFLDTIYKFGDTHPEMRQTNHLGVSALDTP